MLLFIRRAINPRDPWSGNVAFPGGKQDPDDGDDDERTAMRETQEEVGLDLHSWRRLGRLTEDKTIRPRGKKTMVISLFGFILESDEHTPLRPEPGEVADAWWVPADLLCPERVEWRSHPNPNPNPNPNPKPNPDPDPDPDPDPNPNLEHEVARGWVAAVDGDECGLGACGGPAAAAHAPQARLEQG